MNMEMEKEDNVSKDEKLENAENEKKDDGNLHYHLNQFGTKKEKWIKVLKEKFSVTTVTQLQYLSKDETRKLQSYAEHDWEKEALKVLLKKESVPEQMRELQEMISTIKNDESKYEAKHTLQFENKLERLKNKIGITNSDFKIPRKKDELDAFVNSISHHFDELHETVPRKQLKDFEVIENASGGLALCGVYHNYSLKKYQKASKVIEIKDKEGVCLKQCSMTQIDKTETFNSFEKYDEYSRHVETVGVKLSGKVKASCLTASVEAGANYNRQREKEDTKQQNTQKSYYCRERSCAVPVKSFEMTTEKVCLTPQAITRLQNIEYLVVLDNKKDHIQAECLFFFKEFGSFVNMGTLEFGGTYRWKATYESESDYDEENTSKQLATLLTGYVNAGMSFGPKRLGVSVSASYASEDGNTNFKHNQSDNLHTTLQMSKTGGPTEVENFYMWRFGLVSFNSTWSLLDRGELIGIWVIIEATKADFVNSRALASVLKEAWNNRKNIPNKDFKQENILHQELTCIMQEMKLWSLEHTPNIDKCYPILQKLNSAKNRRSEVLGLKKNLFVISDETVKMFFERIVQQKERFDETTGPLVKRIMRQILFPYHPGDWDGCSLVAAWMLPDKKVESHFRISDKIEDLHSFISITEQQFVPYIESQKITKMSDDDYITYEFQQICRSCLINLKIKEKFLDVILMTAILLPFAFDLLKFIFCRRLSASDVKQIIDDVKLLLPMQETESTTSGIKNEIFIASKFMENLRYSGNIVEHVDSLFKVYFSPICNSEKYDKQFRALLNFKEDGSQNENNRFEDILTHLQTTESKCQFLHVSSEGTTLLNQQILSKTEIFKLEDTSESFLSFLNQFDLHEYYPDRIQLNDVFKLKPPGRSVLQDIPWLFLRGILSCSRRSRDEFLAELLDDLNDSESEKDVDPWNSDHVQEISNKISVNPLDLTVVLYQCCSPILKQLLADKMLLCKLAFPLVINHQESLFVNLWATRQCILEERTNETHKEISAADIGSPIVSVIRLGDISMSKSIIINKLISKKSHDTFHHRHCSLGTSRRVISNGTIESAWCISTNRNINYLNMRGDALKHTTQVDLCLQISSVLVVMLPIGELEKQCTKDLFEKRNILSPACRIIWAFDGEATNKAEARKVCDKFRKRHNLHQMTTLMCCLALRDNCINLDIMCKDLHASISRMLNKQDKKSLPNISKEEKILISAMDKQDEKSLSARLEGCDIPEVHVDESFQIYTKYRQRVEYLMTLVPQKVSNLKESILPLQGQLLQSLSDALKTANKSSEKLGNKKIDDLLNTVKRKRMEQGIKYTQQPLPFIKTFLDDLIRLYQSGEHYIIFVRYLKLFLDQRSREVIPEEREKYKQIWGKIQQAQKTNNCVSNSLKEEFKACEKNLAEASIGIEHIFREFGQIFEVMSYQKTHLSGDELIFIERIPEIAANLLLQGESFELMNGDVGNIPVIWIESVFSHLKGIIGDKRVLILSVLGIQSSGKSTLLNTMFGLQFSVSAGRCTRGLYMQLLPVGNNKDFDYLLVVDTEGIRAPELKDKRYDHDNELATYVIGIGDVILINIKGENTVEITDILGIVVQALLRLKNVNETTHLKKRCLFVHQNVAASDASDKMLQQRQNLVDELNERTREAAEQENVQDVHLFSDILHFDLDYDVIYFPDLWDGSPPMASVNPDYSEHAEKVKDSVLSRNIPDRNTYFTISETVTRMKDLWNGLLADDFVFSFRNNLELKAYMRIQSIFQEISFELETHMNDYVRNECNTELHNQIEKSPILDVSTIERDMEQKSVSKLKELQQKLELIFEKDEKKDIVIQWKQSKNTQLEILYERLIPNARKRLQILADETKFKLSQDQRIADFEKKAYDMANTLANEFRGFVPEDDILEQRFELAWFAIIKDVNTDDTGDTLHTISSEIDNILSVKFRDQVTNIERFQSLLRTKKKTFDEMKKLSGSLAITDINADSLEIRRTIFQSMKGFLSNTANTDAINKMLHQAIQTTNFTFQTIDDEIEKFASTTNTKFDATFVKILFNIIETDINEHNKQNTYQFKLTKVHQSLLLAHTSFYLKKKLSDMNAKYNIKYSLKSIVEQQKTKSRKLFRLMVTSASRDSIAAYCFEELLSSAVENHIQKQIPTKVADKILKRYHYSKYDLIKNILSDLTTKQIFDDFMRYVHHPEAFAKTYLKTITCETFFTKTDGCKTKYFRIAENQAGIDFQTVSDIMYELDQCKNSLKNTQFTELLRMKLQTKVGISISSCAFAQIESQMMNKQKFIESILERLESMKESILEKFQVISDINVEWAENPYNIIMDIIWGCDAKCPFCYEPCMIAQKDHLKDSCHKCVSHRVDGVTGAFWEKDSTLSAGFCNIFVSQGSVKFKHDDIYINYRDYKTIYPDWDIMPNPETSVYWKWFCCKYQVDLEKKYGMKMNIVDHWKELSLSNAIESLRLGHTNLNNSSLDFPAPIIEKLSPHNILALHLRRFARRN